MSAIFALIGAMTFSAPVNGTTTWATTSQRLALWADVAPEAQPYAALVTHREVDEYRGLGLLRRRLELQVWCYCREDATGAIGQSDLDVLMQAFERTCNVIDNTSTGCNTLGGLVYWCRIEGRVFKLPGDLDNQAMLIVPIVVEMP